MMVPLKAGDVTAFRKLFKFLIKCQTIKVDGYYNPLDTSEIICSVLSKLPVHLQDRWSRRVDFSFEEIFKRTSADRPNKHCFF